MIKQYVGARYVPKFASPVEWAADTSYEALTIVTFNNASYTSKVTVPPTVGNPANNPQYWTMTGNYNAQVEEYRQDVNKAIESVKEATQQRFHNFIVIGDSWADGIGATTGKGWPSFLVNEIEHDTWIPSFYGGSGFVATGTGREDRSFLDLLKLAEQHVTDKNKIDCILVAGGVNDSSYSVDSITTALGEFMNYAKANYPNAVVFFVSCNTTIGKGYDNFKYLNAYNSFTDSKYIFADRTHCAPLGTYVNTLHCNEEGYKDVAKNIKYALQGVPEFNGYHELTADGFKVSGGSETLIVSEVYYNGKISIGVPEFNVPLNLDYNTYWIVNFATDQDIMLFYSPNIELPVMVNVTTSDNISHYTTANFSLTSNKTFRLRGVVPGTGKITRLFCYGGWFNYLDRNW